MEACKLEKEMLTYLNVSKLQISAQKHLCKAELLPLPPWVWKLGLSYMHKYFFPALRSKSKLAVKGYANVSCSGNTLLLWED